MIRLGVAVRIIGQAGLRARDGRRAEHAPHLSVSVLLVREVLLYLAAQQIHCYRLADNLAPYLTDPQRPQFAHQIEESADLLAELGALARRHSIRLTMHLPMHITLAALDDAIATRSLIEIIAQSALLDAMQAGPESVLVVHVGGAHGDRTGALERFATRYERLPVPARRRVAVEIDEDSFALPDVLQLHQRTGVPIVFDTLHHQLHNPTRLPLGAALGLALATWPADVRPKVHVSSQRTEAHLLPAKRGDERRVLAPLHGQHADFINPFDFARLLEAARGLPPFDVMLEAKAADLALLRLREDLRRFVPELAGMVC